MPLTREFKETVLARVRADPEFGRTLLSEAVDLFLSGDPETAKLVLRDLVNATVGFEALAAQMNKPPKSLHRMLSSQGNPTMSNLSAVLQAVQQALRVSIQTTVSPV